MSESNFIRFRRTAIIPVSEPGTERPEYMHAHVSHRARGIIHALITIARERRGDTSVTVDRVPTVESTRVALTLDGQTVQVEARVLHESKKNGGAVRNAVRVVWGTDLDKRGADSDGWSEPKQGFDVERLLDRIEGFEQVISEREKEREASQARDDARWLEAGALQDACPAHVHGEVAPNGASYDLKLEELTAEQITCVLAALEIQVAHAAE